MYKLLNLTQTTAASYEKLTYPTFRKHLRTLNSNNSIVAIGGNFGVQPVGLILANIPTDRKSAEILSWFVIPEHRGRGLGKTLLTTMEKELNQQGCSQASLVYVSNATTPSLEHILKQCNWSTPKLRMLVCSSSRDCIKDAPWLKLENALPSSYTIFPWVKLTVKERKIIQKKQAVSPWYPEILCPFQEEDNIEPVSSLGLRYKGEVVGWIINHRVAKDTVRYTKLFVRQELQKLGRAIPLLAKSIRLQLENMEVMKGVFTVIESNTTMVDFVYRRFTPYLNSIRQSWGSSKSIEL
jgi:predicted GNAT family acetyltransferase